MTDSLRTAWRYYLDEDGLAGRIPSTMPLSATRPLKDGANTRSDQAAHNNCRKSK